MLGIRETPAEDSRTWQFLLYVGRFSMLLLYLAVTTLLAALAISGARLLLPDEWALLKVSTDHIWVVLFVPLVTVKTAIVVIRANYGGIG